MRKWLLILGFLIACSPAFGQCSSPCLVAATAVSGSGTSKTITIAGLTAGKTLVVSTWFRNTPGTASITSDTCSASWTQDFQNIVNVQAIAIFHATVPAACASTTVTVGYSFSTNANYVMASEWDNFAASPFDQSAFGGSTATILTRLDTLSTAPTAQANEVWYAVAGSTVNLIGPVPGFAVLDNTLSGAFGTYYFNSTQIAGARAALTANAKTSGQGIIAIVAYKLATVGTDTGATVHSSGSLNTAGSVSVSGSRTITAGTTYADWTGIDAMAPGTTANASSASAGDRIGTSNWQWNFSGLLASTKYTVVTNGTDALCPNNGHNCLALEYVTNAGTTTYANHIYVSPTYSSWSGDPSQQATDVSTSGVWFQFYVAIDSNTATYLGNTNAQVKYLLQAYDAADYRQAATNGQADGGGGFWMIMSGTAGGAHLWTVDNSQTGGTFQVIQGDTSAGATIRGHFWRNTATTRGHVQASVNDAEIVNTETQAGITVTPNWGGSFRLGTNTGSQIMGWPLGIRYFQACSNACANTTLHVVIQNAKLCNYNCVGYP